MAGKNTREDPRGSKGGDTGQTTPKGKGAEAEKGDWQRDEPTHSGPTRTGSNANGRPGSRSNEER